MLNIQDVECSQHTILVLVEDKQKHRKQRKQSLSTTTKSSLQITATSSKICKEHTQNTKA
jgi:hypothetical protein